MREIREMEFQSGSNRSHDGAIRAQVWGHRLVGAALSVGLGLGAVGFVGLGTIMLGTAGPVAAAGGPAVKIGALLPLTGGLAPFGPGLQHAAELAVAQINAQGGLGNGQLLQLVVRDTQTSPQPAIDAATKLVTIDRVPAVMGPFASGEVAAAASAVTIPRGVLLITPSATAPSISDLKDHDLVFRTTSSDALQGRVMGQVAYDGGYRRVAVIYENTDYGQGQARYFAQEFQAKGGKVTASVPFETGKASYRGELQRAANGSPEALLIVAYPDTGGITVLRQAVEEGFFDKFLFTDGMQTSDLAKAVGAKVLEGALGSGPQANPNAPTLKTFRSAYQAKFGEPPLEQPFVASTYDATFLIALALERSRVAQGERLQDSLRAVANAPGEPIYPGEWAKAKRLIDAGKDIDYVGASGPVEFDAQGDIMVATVGIWRFHNGEIVTDRILTARSQ